MDLAGTAGARCDAKHHSPVLQKQNREAARLSPVPSWETSPALHLGHGDGFGAAPDGVVAAGYPWLAVVGFLVVAVPFWAILSPLRKRVERELEQQIVELCVFEGEHRL